MITIEVKHENDNGTEFGYGVYVNAYVTWDDITGDIGSLYASECVPFGQNTPEKLDVAEKRVRAKARRIAKREWMN
jgi:hypothetical protein